jgi:biotin carboxylase
MPLSVDVAACALAQAKVRGIRTHVTNQGPTLVATPSVSDMADAASDVDFERPADSARWAAAQIAAGERFDVVFGVREMAQVAVAEVAAAVGAPGNPPHAVRRVRTKDACRAALAAAGFPQPAVRLCPDADAAAAAMRESTGPWVVKPRDAMGSEGVSLVRDVADLPGAMALLPGPGPFLVEDFVDGPEFSVEGIFIGGTPHILAVTAKEKTSPPSFVEIGHVLPAELPEPTRCEIARQVVSALDVLELSFGLFHAELWLTSAGVVLGEVHVRNGGDWIHRMLEYAVPGLELFGLVYDDALGRPIDRSALRPVRSAATRFLTASPGRLVRVEGWSEVVAHPAVLYAELTSLPGDVIEPVRSSDDRLGAVVVARELARELTSSVRFVTEQPITEQPIVEPAVSVAGGGTADREYRT